VTALTVLALLVALVSLGIALLSWRRTSSLAGRRARADRAAADLPDDVYGLRQEVAALRMENADALKHLAVVRYDAFRDMGGHLSWSVALLDDHGSGVVLTSIHGRSDSRTYAKNVVDWTTDQQLSPEEEQAVDSARPQG
jgi:hypothetical protein